MANWIFNAYDSIAEAEIAIELIANTVTIHVFGFKEGSKQKICVIKSV